MYLLTSGHFRLEFTADPDLAEFLGEAATVDGRSEAGFLRRAAVERAEKILSRPAPGREPREV